MDQPSGVNADQIAYWNSEIGRKWADNQQRIDAVFAPMTAQAVAFAGAVSGARILDIGCGAGASVLALADAVGPTGRVTGVDVSAPMLEVAGRRTAGLGQVTLALADAATHDFLPGLFDLVFSRFGVMFFDDPPAAFAHVRRAMRPGGRLVFVCWRPMADNPFFLVPFQAAKSFAPPQPPPDPTAPGPFALSDPERVRAILGGAGFTDIALIRHDSAALTGDLESSLGMATRIGPASRLMNEVDEATRVTMRHAMEAALAGHVRNGTVALGIGLWFVSAVA